VPRPRIALRVTFSPQEGELCVEGDPEQVKAFMEWYLEKVSQLQKAQQSQPEQKQAEPQHGAPQEKPKTRAEAKKPQPQVAIDTSGLPSFAQDNPWIGILSKKH
jgi:hypothetical protein